MPLITYSFDNFVMYFYVKNLHLNSVTSYRYDLDFSQVWLVFDSIRYFYLIQVKICTLGKRDDSTVIEFLEAKEFLMIRETLSKDYVPREKRFYFGSNIYLHFMGSEEEY